MILKNNVLYQKKSKPIVWDAFFNASNSHKPLVVFCHGYKGFKDWGCWDLVAEHFKNENCVFIKFNFSHNGGTVENPIDFPDLDAFAENNYTKELYDIEALLDYLISDGNSFRNEIDFENITLIGHSRGGGISILKASEDSRIKKLITWASICDFGKRTATIGGLEQWKKEGVKYVLNGRTKQKMPHNYQLYEDYINNEERLNIKSACKKLSIPHLIIHAKEDSSVLCEEARALHRWNSESTLLIVENSNHVFNSKHPWETKELPEQLQKVVDKSIDFVLRTK
jgi:pimeloyl-ACP methyl ester carboxylesterase